jgi:hypothetical protein
VSEEPGAIPQPTPDERKIAMLAHVMQLFGSFVAPLIIFLVKRDSKFVKFHALQPLIWQAVVWILTIVVMIGLFTTMILTIPSQHNDKQPPFGMFLFMFGFWGLMMANWVINLILAIYFGIKANDGAWSRYPLIGRLAAHWAGIQ